MSLSAAKSRVTQAKDSLESGRRDVVESVLEAAEGYLDRLEDPDEIEQAPAVREQIAEIRARLAAMMSPEDERKLSAAKGKVRQARSQIESNYVTYAIEDTLRVAEEFLDGIADEHRAPVLAEIAEVRAQLAPDEPAAPEPSEVAEPAVAEPAEAAEPLVPEPRGAAEPEEVLAARPNLDGVGTEWIDPRPDAVPAGQPAAFDPSGFQWVEAEQLSDEDAANLSRARSRISQARTLLEVRRTENVEYTLEEAAGFLADVGDRHKAQLLLDIDAVRAELRGALASEDVRRIEEELNRHVSTAESNIGVHPHHTDEALARLAQRLSDEDVVGILPPESIERYRARAAEIQARHSGNTRSEAIDRAMPLLEELERRLDVDPFAGLPQHEAYRVTRDLRTLKDRVLAAIGAVPDDDPEIVAIGARLLATDRKIDEASVAWGKAELDAQVSRGWDAIKADIEGWEQEEPETDGQLLAQPAMPKTRLAVHRVRYLLTDAETIRIRAENPDDAELMATYREAEQVFEAAGAKLHWAYTRVLDAAEQVETPMNRFDLDRASMLAHAAEQAFEGTRYLDTNVGRARDLDERWQAEVAAIMKARQDLYDKLAVEADAVWPAIVDTLRPDTSFDPRDPGLAGRTVLLEGVYNRSGWDFDGGAYDFAVRYEGVPLGGDYEPHVRAALEHAWYELKLDVNDRITWDVVAVVEGPGTIGRRTTVVLRDKDTNQEIGRIEEWPPEDCVRLRVVALHAGPVAVGPPS